MKNLFIVAIVFQSYVVGMEAPEGRCENLHKTEADFALESQETQPLTFEKLKTLLFSDVYWCQLLTIYYLVGKKDSRFVNPDAYFKEGLHNTFSYFFDPKSIDKKPQLSESSVDKTWKYYRNLTGAYKLFFTPPKNNALITLETQVEGFNPTKFKFPEQKEKHIIKCLQFIKKNKNNIKNWAENIINERFCGPKDVKLSEELECYSFLATLSEGTVSLCDDFLYTTEEFLKKNPEQFSDEEFAAELYNSLTNPGLSSAEHILYIFQIIDKHHLYDEETINSMLNEKTIEK